MFQVKNGFLIAVVMLLFTAQVRGEVNVDLYQQIEIAAEKHDISPVVIASIIKIESDGDACAMSHVGAQGLLQFMPKTALMMGLQDPFSPVQSVDKGAELLKSLLIESKGNYLDMAAMYNAGGKGKSLAFHELPDETQQYLVKFNNTVNKGTHNWKILLPNYVLGTTREICSAIREQNEEKSVLQRLTALWQ